MEKRFLSRIEAVEFMDGQISLATVDREIREGNLLAVRIRDRVLLERSELQRYLERARTRPGAVQVSVGAA
jgi:excisionase family DNA binding protein